MADAPAAWLAIGPWLAAYTSGEANPLGPTSLELTLSGRAPVARDRITGTRSFIGPRWLLSMRSRCAMREAGRRAGEQAVPSADGPAWPGRLADVRPGE